MLQPTAVLVTVLHTFLQLQPTNQLSVWSSHLTFVLLKPRQLSSQNVWYVYCYPLSAEIWNWSALIHYVSWCHLGLVWRTSSWQSNSSRCSLTLQPLHTQVSVAVSPVNLQCDGWWGTHHLRQSTPMSPAQMSLFGLIHTIGMWLIFIHICSCILLLYQEPH